MNEEEIMENIKKAADVINWSVEQTKERFDEICSQNQINVSESPRLALGLFNQWFVQQKKRQENPDNNNNNNAMNDNDNGPKKIFGFFVAMEDAKNFSDLSANKAVAQYQRDPQTTYEVGMVAIAVSNGEGYQLSAKHDGEEKVKDVEKLPGIAREVDEGKWVIPLNTQKTGWNGSANPNYGRPLPKDNWQLTGHFVGSVSGQPKHYMFRIRGNSAQTFKPETFRLLHFNGMVNDEKGMIYGIDKDFQTVLSLEYNDELSAECEYKVDESTINISDTLASTMGNYMSPLLGLGQYHIQSMDKPWNEKMVISDGDVVNIRPQPTKNGNRIIYLSDLNADFDYNDGGTSSTTVWIPPSIDIDFGIGSHVLVVGRTSQGKNEDGSLGDVSINLQGLYVINRRGAVVEYDNPDEEDFDWF